MTHSGFASDTRAGAVLEGGNAGVASQLFRVIDSLHFVGGNKQFGRDHRADARHRDHQIEQFFQPSVGLNEFLDLLLDGFLFVFEDC